MKDESAAFRQALLGDAGRPALALAVESSSLLVWLLSLLVDCSYFISVLFNTSCEPGSSSSKLPLLFNL